ncbi:hypothetical protein COV53_06835 [Candidatus Gottesmanbacteria bacterium CG11_big_fil_rev_8_21_14_0_20_37_11]|uniref:tRNA-dihydrouridine synthase n=3 Tax=Candidatus Gottesmaniibacteriota TaxID=1752720 RepID=A0A2M7RS05_9BACT|nr:MAG: hypothetical protein AUJ73_04325 [Candidatus Gottesmanbacteria bacterium CG1_02_37_22]PIP32213.1 MAG: hypothetical protein COX23_05925 [Candidatus Gottesmanbacteria bacterium CG23_combo_of_CG06-09_8_20_14_all_37_19]PIR07709.1 MAG: hypothetical protein COV53_06835 [Candidatus Gottesmanbacteria bacterium CG11_big_fil_rev_8_21_14_0_20_37_11]PIZ03087.1 MAG: hypothetical protein COY59_01335 [Candidatus Gottesmanbacteria bacterium CG_4_10_14_0_8_um_filter_37_24]
MNNFWYKIKRPIIGLAPMDSVTDTPMRQIQTMIAKPGLMYTEFLSVDGFLKKPDVFNKHLKYSPNERPIIVQLFGADPKSFKSVIDKVSALGFDGIDINMGCPARSIVRKGGGGGLIGNFNLSREILEIVYQGICRTKRNIPLSVKTRIGENKEATKNWFDFLSKLPLSVVCIHGRTLSQGLSGRVKWEEVKLAAKILHSKGILCLGNGDVKSLDDAHNKSKLYDLDGILIGRAALGNPWVFLRGSIPSKEEIFRVIIQHSELVSSFYHKKDFIKARKHFGWYCRNFYDANKLKVELMRTESKSEVKKIINKYRKY